MRSLIFVLLVLFALTVATAFLTRNTSQTAGTQNNSAQQIQATNIKPKAVLKFEPSVINAKYPQSVSVSLNAVYQGEKPDFAQFELGFDPEVIGDISVDQGNFFSSPEILLNSIDEINGRISYAIKSDSKQDAPDYNSEIINIKFRIKSMNTDFTTIYFLPKTGISAENEDIELDMPEGVDVYIENTASPSVPYPSI